MNLIGIQMTIRMPSLNNDLCCNVQAPSYRQGMSSCYCSTSPQRRGLLSKDRAGSQYHRPNECYSQDFSHGTNMRAHSVCTICLGTHMHNVYTCEASRTWDGRHATVAKRVRNNVHLQENNTFICMEWQWARGCTSNKHDSKHVCSGCSLASHAAHACP